MFKEQDILDVKFRANVIKEIMGAENQARKLEQYKRYEVYKDKVAKHTKILLLKQFDDKTVKEMEISLTNVSLCKKIINKLSRVYAAGVERTLKKKRGNAKAGQEVFDKFQKHIKINSVMKKANRYLRIHYNIWVMALPKAIRDAMGNILNYDLKLSVLPPFLFDVIEDPEDKENAKVLILSNFIAESGVIKSDDPARNGQRGVAGQSSPINNFARGDGKDQVIADTPMDSDPKNRNFIWWSQNYHFVTDTKGVISGGPKDFQNPIKVIPGISLNADQDGDYYSQGGEDLIDSCILANAMMTNINHIGIQQGYGQAWMRGKNLPQQVRLGPTNIIKLEMSAEGESSEFGFANSNAPLNELKELTVTQIALLLSTNNLSTKGVKVNLDSGVDFPSGVAAMIDQSESTEDVKDQVQLFLDQEPSLWEILKKWVDLYKERKLLIEDLQEVDFDPKEILINILEAKPIQSESEKLDNLKKRKDLGINTMIELIKMDNPGITDEEAEKKLLELTEEKQKQMLEAQANMDATGGKPNGSDPNAGKAPNGKPQKPGGSPVEKKEKEDELN